MLEHKAPETTDNQTLLPRIVKR